jgi:hypothetical protein
MSTLITKKPVNYLNNKDILKEIHASKNSYCSYADPKYHQYDFIVDYLDNSSLESNLEYLLRPSTIQQAKENRAARLSMEAGERGSVSAESIAEQDLIFRVMTWDHIPVAPKQPRKVVKKKSAKEIFEFEEDEESVFDDLIDTKLEKEMGLDDMVHVRVNFPPFQHFAITENNTLKCVGKSHWIGNMQDGEFSKDHGQITNKLAKMYLMLCEKYALRFNWRGYTYNDEMRGAAILQLTYVGLRFNEAKSQNPFAYYTAAINNSFCRVLNTEKRNQNIRDDILEINNLNPSWSRQYAHEYEKHSKVESE